MAKVIMTIAPEDGMCFEEIMSFKTENYIGIYNNVDDRFALLNKSAVYYEPYSLKLCEDLKELDDAVFEEVDEHIIEVFDRSLYTLTLD